MQSCFASSNRSAAASAYMVDRYSVGLRPDAFWSIDPPIGAEFEQSPPGQSRKTATTPKITFWP
jgi:hypothetical protein